MALTVLRSPALTTAAPPAPDTTPLRVAVEVHQRARGAGALCLMTLTGPLDHAAGPRLRSALEPALLRTWAPRGPRDDVTGGAAAAAGPSASAAAPDVVVDLAAVDPVDAAGVDVLLTVLRRTTALGGRAAVVGAGDHVVRLLGAADARGEVLVSATLSGAVSAWAPGRSGAAAPAVRHAQRLSAG